ncbi:hypothetical protein B4102_0563 [Heyndrickxia sporothermodurans]|uniref:Uncharacterized protein n=1 Tax=Heyndrickxia sporothermodurans TaxID=46224 RepID=A0A150L792_9BACI|nr:hypothetical protein [Heyndrickxia sporothermodurans]KYD07929.1 hypothetical protein B4102_0563 [Heyndrickxia sporothermodurans]
MASEIKLSTNELVSALALCGHDHIASQILNENKLINNDKEFERFVSESEWLLKQKGYWDEERETKITAGLEDLLHLLVHSRRRVRCVKQNRVLFIHYLDDKNSMIQHVKENDHTFSFHENKLGYYELLCEYFEVQTNKEKDVDNLRPIQVSDEMFDELHTIEKEVIEAMIEDKSLDKELRIFLKDFRRNKQELDNISFIESNYVRDENEIDQIAFLLPSDEFIWHIDYEKVNDGEIYFAAINNKEYFDKIDETIKEFF